MAEMLTKKRARTSPEGAAGSQLASIGEPAERQNGNQPVEAARILILCRSTGTGPRRGGLAVERALHQLDPQAIVRTIDILGLDAAHRQRRATEAGIRMQIESPYKLARLYDLADRPPEERHYTLKDRLRFRYRNLRRRIGNRRLIRALLPELQSEPWDLIINVGATGDLIAGLRSQGRIDVPQFLLTTDFYTHRALVTGYYRHYFVATEEGAAYLEALGVKHRRISITGTPVQPEFNLPLQRETCRREHGLALDRPVILQMSGGLGMGPVEKVFRLLLQVKTPVTLVTVCGNNAGLRTALEAVPVPARHQVKIVGYTNKIHELMRAADIVVSKSGGMTSAEVLASGAAMVVIEPYPGLEMQNCEYMLENGVAIKCQHLESLPFQINQLLKQPERLAAMRENARKLGRPQAAFTIARYILDWVRKKRLKSKKD